MFNLVCVYVCVCAFYFLFIFWLHIMLARVAKWLRAVAKGCVSGLAVATYRRLRKVQDFEQSASQMRYNRQAAAL